MNIECSQQVLDEIESAFRFNDAVLRHLTLTCQDAITEKSAMMKEVEREESAKTTDRKPVAEKTDSVDEKDSAAAADTVAADTASADIVDAEPEAEESTTTAGVE